MVRTHPEPLASATSGVSELCFRVQMRACTHFVLPLFFRHIFTLVSLCPNRIPLWVPVVLSGVSSSKRMSPGRRSDRLIGTS